MRREEIVERLKGVAAECEDFDDYTMHLNTHGEDMTFLQLAGWALCGNNTSRITQQTVRDCIEAKGYQGEGESIWKEALLTAIRNGEPLFLVIETMEDDNPVKYLPDFFTLPPEAL